MSNQMKEIDWSKAPEGAQAYMPKSSLWAEGWWKASIGKKFFCHAGKDEWEETHADPFGHHGLVYRPDTERAAAWDGEGLPPVGVACEVENDIEGGWDAVDEVLAHTEIKGAAVAVFKRDDRVFYSPDGTFRPIRTPEQIAAEERQKAIEQIASDALGRCDIHGATYLYNAGYRKVTS